MNNNKKIKVAVVGATGLVGGKMIDVLQERNFPIYELIPVASEKSVGKKLIFNNSEHEIFSIDKAIESCPDIALFSAGAEVSKKWAPKFAERGCVVIDNSSCWRMDPNVKLIVPEVNGHILNGKESIIANPNCSTIQMLVALAPLHKMYKLKRIVVSTYQSVTGSGMKGITQMINERANVRISMSNSVAYHYPIDMNIIPHIDSFLDNGYTKEEMKMVNETHKIFNDYSIGVSATTVRVPVTGGHSESVNAEFFGEIDLDKIREIYKTGPSYNSLAPGVVLLDDPSNNLYPMPLNCFGKDDVYVGRLRIDESAKNCVNMWIVSDNLRKGAATNAVQIAEKIYSIKY